MIVMTLWLLNKLIRLLFDIGQKRGATAPLFMFTRTLLY